MGGCLFYKEKALINKNDGHYYAFPILSDDTPIENLSFQRDILCGTCFSLKNGIFLTAGHVAEAALQRKYCAVEIWEEGYKPYYFEKNDVEIFTDYDLAILKTKKAPPNVCEFLWETRFQTSGPQVNAIGFAHGFDLEQKALTLRKFTGFIVASLTYCKNIPAKCGGYELSFVSPTDLSGSPLLLNNVLIGYIKGVSESKIRTKIYETVEKENDGIKRITEEYELVSFSIAVRTDAILSLQSKILGTTIIDYLRNNNFIK